MSPVDPRSVFSALGTRQGTGSSRYFVGRGELLSELEGCCSGETRSAAWLHGPRRSGKTSVAEELVRRAGGNGTLALCVDAIDVESFEELLRRICDKAQALGVSCAGPDMRSRFEALARSSLWKPLLLVVDEVDSVALRLSTSEQGFLRRVKGEHSRLGYLFISILDPAQIVEEVPEISSRLLGVCIQGRVQPLRRREVEELCRTAAEDLGLAQLGQDAGAIWEAFGGFAVAVRAALQKLAVGRHYNPDFDDEERSAKVQAVGRELEVDLRSYWWSLQSATRAALSGQHPPTECVPALRFDGLYDRRGLTGYRHLRDSATRWNAALHQQAITTNDGIVESAVGLFRHIADLNEALRHRGKATAFRGGDQAFQLYQLVRTPCSEDAFKTAIDFLYKVFYEGARAIGGAHPKAWLLPAPLDREYGASEVVQAINDLRCLFFHDKTREQDVERSNRHYESAGAIYMAYCGSPQPADDTSRAVVRDAIVRRLHALVSGLHARVATDQLD